MTELMPIVAGLAVVNTALLAAIFFRLGSLGERVSGLERRTDNLEGKSNVGLVHKASP